MPGQRIDYAQEIGQARALQLVGDKRRGSSSTNALGCWEFSGSVNTDGYGQIFAKKNSNLLARGRASQTAFLLHIVSFLARNGRSPSQHCSHLCDNRKCFNPDHLVDEAAQVNNSRKGCWGDILCPEHGHPIVIFCAHAPKCVRAPMTAEHVICCESLREIAGEHSSQPGLLSVFVDSSSRPGTVSPPLSAFGQPDA